MFVPVPEGSFNRMFDLARFGFPGAEPDSGHLSTGVELDRAFRRHYWIVFTILGERSERKRLRFTD